MRCGSGESQEEDGKVRPQRAANTGAGRDTKHQSPNRLAFMDLDHWFYAAPG